MNEFVSLGRAIDYLLSSATCERGLDRRARCYRAAPRSCVPSVSNCRKTLAILQQERELLEHGAYIDSLTNLGNRGGLDRHVDQLWRKGTPFTCAYIDIDRLKHATISLATPRAIANILSICRAPHRDNGAR